MLVERNAELRRAVADAVKLVNAQPGRTNITLEFDADDQVDFVANSASFSGENFVFIAGFETYGGSLRELAGIRANVIS